MAKTIPTKLIAPCGMNCRLCRAYIRDSDTCPGCRGDDSKKSQYCVSCRIKNCEHFAPGVAKYCFSCDSFPCKRLKQMDRRYRARYSMSVIENLEAIRDSGIRQFIRNEKRKWTCPKCGEVLCVHKPKCLSCGYAWQDK